MIFPLVILCVIALIGMMIFFYTQVELQCRMDMALRQEAGSRTGTGYRLNCPGYDFSISEERGNRIHTEVSLSFVKQGLLHQRTKIIEADLHLVRWGASIRKWDMLKRNKGSTESEK